MSYPLGSTEETIRVLKLVANGLFILSALTVSGQLFAYGLLKAEGPARRGCYLLGSFLVGIGLLSATCVIMQVCGQELWSAQLRVGTGVVLVVLTIAMALNYKHSPNLKTFRRLELHARSLEERNAKLEKEAKQTAAQAATNANLIANLSHGMRSSLSAVVGFHELLLGTKLNDEQKQLAAATSDSAQQMMTLVNEMQDLVRIDQGHINFELTSFKVSELVQEVCATSAEYARRKKLFFNTDIDASIPELVSGDRKRLKQILDYLVTNAIKHTENGGITLGASVQSALPAAILLEFRVRDTGMHLNQEEQNQLFNPLDDVLSAGRRRFGEYGLRLYLARRLVELMGGAITVQSAKPQGVEFNFTIQLPIVQATSPVANAISS